MPTNETKTPAAAKPAKAATVKAPAAVKPASAPKAAAAPKATTVKVAKPATTGKLPISDRKPASGATVTITQVHSGAGRLKAQRGTLIGLGLGVMNRTRTLEDTPAVRGMIARVSHLVKVEGESRKKTGTK